MSGAQYCWPWSKQVLQFCGKQQPEYDMQVGRSCVSGIQRHPLGPQEESGTQPARASTARVAATMATATARMVWQLTADNAVAAVGDNNTGKERNRKWRVCKNRGGKTMETTGRGKDKC